MEEQARNTGERTGQAGVTRNPVRVAISSFLLLPVFLGPLSVFSYFSQALSVSRAMAVP